MSLHTCRLGVLAVLTLVAGSGCDEHRAVTTAEHLTSECLTCSTGLESERCVDGLDNDGDGLTDCQDADCAGAFLCRARGPENTVERCFDGFDNDGNGFTDCADFSCSREADVCKSEVQQDETNDDLCTDGLDNDWNGFIDCNDFSCSRADGVTVCEGVDATCSDGIDNDGNGFTDCGDFGCSDNSQVTVCQ